tara:strand:+ start:254 stop:454 length:201 start_codon:yes stop_codon:yes gene_type:complete
LLSTSFLLKKGKCCGHGCLKCPYIPRHSGKTNRVNPDIYAELDDWEIKELEEEGFTFNYYSNEKRK